MLSALFGKTYWEGTHQQSFHFYLVFRQKKPAQTRLFANMSMVCLYFKEWALFPASGTDETSELL